LNKLFNFIEVAPLLSQRQCAAIFSLQQKLPESVSPFQPIGRSGSSSDQWETRWPFSCFLQTVRRELMKVRGEISRKGWLLLRKSSVNYYHKKNFKNWWLNIYLYYPNHYFNLCFNKN
jgi:hypothetical protein